MPLTPQAQLTRPVLKVAPRVAGQVSELAVSNNQYVQPGQLLFRLDPQPFELEVQRAELALEQAHQDNTELDALLAAARAEVSAAQAKSNESGAQALRLSRLLERQHVSRQAYDAAEAQHLMAQAQTGVRRRPESVNCRPVAAAPTVPIYGYAKPAMHCSGRTCSGTTNSQRSCPPATDWRCQVRVNPSNGFMYTAPKASRCLRVGASGLP